MYGHDFLAFYEHLLTACFVNDIMLGLEAQWIKENIFLEHSMYYLFVVFLTRSPHLFENSPFYFQELSFGTSNYSPHKGTTTDAMVKIRHS